jgi:hypothetical protein
MVECQKYFRVGKVSINGLADRIVASKVFLWRPEELLNVWLSPEYLLNSRQSPQPLRA